MTQPSSSEYGKLGVSEQDVKSITKQGKEQKRRSAMARVLLLLISLLAGMGVGALWYLRPFGPTYPYCIGATGTIVAMKRWQLAAVGAFLFVFGYVISYFGLAPYIFWETHERPAEWTMYGVSPEYGVFTRPQPHDSHSAGAWMV